MRVKNRASGYIRSTRSRFGQITLAIVVLPPFLKMAFSLSSMASGLALVMLTIVVWESVKATTLVDRRSLPQSGNRAIFCFATLQFILAHAIWTNIVTSEFDFSRFAPSFAYLALMLASALLLIQRVMRRTSDAEVGRAIHLCLKFLALNAIFGLTGLTFFESGSLKQTGLFSEPSHLALAVAPFLVYTCLTKEKYSNHFLLGFMLWGIVIQNLTMLVAVTLAFAASSELKLKVKYVAVAGLFLTPIFVIDVSYFADRLFISDENTNLSVLVLLQGWQNALLLMDQSGGGGADSNTSGGSANSANSHNASSRPVALPSTSTMAAARPASS